VRVYTVIEMADTLHVTPETLKEYIKDGKMTAFKVGNQWRMTDKDLSDYVDARRKEREGVE